MTTTNQINENGFSRDYLKLCELIKTQAMICVADLNDDDGISRDVTLVSLMELFEQKPNYYIHRLVHAFSKRSFIKECQRLNLSFVVPKED